ncbi:hypothetical protein DOTSEDRAFT_29241 [Dothistroma septosporum NZE10]|uniref:Uncharacterized protein n=1 Tax=Dothistroma septosporum (strain NZE10 / CBS 128990) TaxID=675120 RepID=M2XHX0_DOTSN|nr:hypothetical protein DOTSEDRAFT_29241 [Dothistroma septosporum NZE10]
MSTGTIFITASDADFKVANRFLLYIRDWEHDSGDSFHIKLNKTHEGFDVNGDNTVTEAGSLNAENFTNDWRGASLSDVEAWMLEATKRDPTGDPSLWIAFNDKGLEQKTCILAQRRMREDDYDLDPAPTFDFNKMRIAWEELYEPWCNLEIANMDFQDYAGESPDEEGWWEYDSSITDDLSEEKRKLRDDALKKLEEEGKA